MSIRASLAKMKARSLVPNTQLLHVGTAFAEGTAGMTITGMIVTARGIERSWHIHVPA